jgi:pyrimidine-nucleoside phosphorylase
LPVAEHVAYTATLTYSDGPWYVTGIDAGKVGEAAMLLGAGRRRAEDAVDHGVGVVVRSRVGDQLFPDQPVFDIHCRDHYVLDQAVPLLHASYTVGHAPPPEPPLVLEEIA